MQLPHSLTVAFTAVFWSSMAFAGDRWPHWRGPTLDGVSKARNTPTEWSDSRNVAWKTALPHWGGATPIVWENRVFVVSASAASEPNTEAERTRELPRGMGGRESPGGRNILLLCIDRAGGKILWQRTVDSRNALFGKQNLASCSPVTDGKHVWAMSGSGSVVCFDFEGAEKWRVDLQEKYGPFQLLWGYASSPLLFEGQLIVQVLHGGGLLANKNAAEGELPTSYLLALDASTGKERWKAARKSDATKECPDAYTSPVIGKFNKRWELIVSGADYVTGHDPLSGTELWRAAGLNPDKEGNYRVCPSPVIVGNLIVAPTRKKPLLALTGGGSGDVSKSALRWKLERNGPDVPTPVSDGTNLYVVEDKGLVTCLNLSSGELVWGPERTAVGPVSASPILADGKIYVVNDNGITTVLATGDQFKKIATNDLEGSYTIASPVLLDGEVLIRSSKHLYCIRNQ